MSMKVNNVLRRSTVLNVSSVDTVTRPNPSLRYKQKTLMIMSVAAVIIITEILFIKNPKFE